MPLLLLLPEVPQYGIVMEKSTVVIFQKSCRDTAHHKCVKRIIFTPSQVKMALDADCAVILVNA